MKTFTLDGIEFVLDIRSGPERDVSTLGRFILVKNDPCLNFYRNWQGPTPKTIMDVGLFEGGSIVFLDKLFRPERIVGVDLRQKPIAPLDDYARENPQMRIYYGCSQDKPETLEAARANFPNGIDLVVDDASHQYAQTKATFSMLFPLVTRGGRYVIEDWAWSHQEPQQQPHAPWMPAPALTNLILELTMMAAVRPVIAAVHATREYAVITKGPGELPPNPFDLRPYLRGREFRLL